MCCYDSYHDASIVLNMISYLCRYYISCQSTFISNDAFGLSLDDNDVVVVVDDDIGIT